MRRNYNYVPFDVALPLLRPGDAALFRGRGIVSGFIASVTASPFTHVGLIDPRSDGGGADLLEFREFKGGRTADFRREAKRNNGRIDVHRFPPVFHERRYDAESGELRCYEKKFSGAGVVSAMRRLTGLPYGYRKILWMLAWKTPGLREILCWWCQDRYVDDRIGREQLRFVCSTAVDYVFRASGFPLVQNKNTNYVDPSDIAQSIRMNYLFTIKD